MAYLLSALFIVLGAPLARNMVGPNRWYGFRTPETLSNSEVWYRVNALGGKALIVAGIASLVGLLVFGVLWGSEPGTNKRIAIMIPLALLAVAIVVALYPARRR